VRFIIVQMYHSNDALLALYGVKTLFLLFITAVLAPTIVFSTYHHDVGYRPINHIFKDRLVIPFGYVAED